MSLQQCVWYCGMCHQGDNPTTISCYSSVFGIVVCVTKVIIQPLSAVTVFGIVVCVTKVIIQLVSAVSVFGIVVCVTKVIIQPVSAVTAVCLVLWYVSPR